MSSANTHPDDRIETALAMAALALLGLGLVAYTGSLAVKLTAAALALAAGLVAWRLTGPAHTDTTTEE